MEIFKIEPRMKSEELKNSNNFKLQKRALAT